MADGFSMKVIVSDTLASFSRIDRATDRATMWAVREVGRKVKQEAMRNAPVYKGPGAISKKKAKEGNPANQPVTGLLRASIHSSRRLKRDGAGGYINHVAVRGMRVHLYSEKIEAQYGYMAAGHAIAATVAPAIAARAWGRAIKRG